MTSELCRITVHIGADSIDVVLPNAVPVALLIPPLWDTARDLVADADPYRIPLARNLCVPGRGALDPSKTLSENEICDGATLVLSTQDPPAPSVGPLQAADRLAQSSARACARWSPRASVLTAALLAVALTGLAGLVVVPGTAGVAHLLLATTATGFAAVIAARAMPRHAPVFATIALGCVPATVISLPVTVIGGSAHDAGVGLAAAAMAILVCSGRLTLTLCGLSRTILDPDTGSAPTRAPAYLTAVVTAAACCALAGTALIIAHAPGPADYALSGVVAAALLLMSRSHADITRRGCLLACGTIAAALSLIVFRLLHAEHAALVSLILVAAAACSAWFATARDQRQLTPTARRCVDVFEGLALATVAPVACWALGFYPVLPSGESA
ncbi:MAG: EsaB/YukD family protein [Mycobacterium sp.]|nr:EsaB/YukD family protein [Mycobacterium sp.]